VGKSVLASYRPLRPLDGPGSPAGEDALRLAMLPGGFLPAAFRDVIVFPAK
jgi:hypothetical protein